MRFDCTFKILHEDISDLRWDRWSHGKTVDHVVELAAERKGCIVQEDYRSGAWWWQISDSATGGPTMGRLPGFVKRTLSLPSQGRSWTGIWRQHRLGSNVVQSLRHTYFLRDEIYIWVLSVQSYDFGERREKLGEAIRGVEKRVACMRDDRSKPNIRLIDFWQLERYRRVQALSIRLTLSSRCKEVWWWSSCRGRISARGSAFVLFRLFCRS